MSGKEDWESEIANPPAYNPNITRLEPAIQGNDRNSFSYKNDFNQSIGSNDRAFGNKNAGDDYNQNYGSSKQSFGSQRGTNDYNQNFGSSEQGFANQRGNGSDRRGFGRGRSDRGRGGSGMFNRDFDSNGNQESIEGFENDGPKRNGFSRRGGFGSNDRTEQGSFAGRDCFNKETSGFGRGRRESRGDGSFSRDGQSGTGRGGYRGRNEEVGVESGKAQDESERSELGPKVTYVPPPPSEEETEIFRHYQTGINFDKYDDIIVDVSGTDAPLAIMTFDEANLSETLRKNVCKAGYVKLTPIQKHSIPVVMAGRDLMACAQTGSGKTAAFLLPILAHMMNRGVSSSAFKELQEPEAIIIAPTRELINQIYLDARKFAHGTVVRPVVIYGGTQTFYSLKQISQGCNILCATPGRLLDVVRKEKIGLSKLQYLVLDEADRMLDMGFREDIYTLLRNPGMPPSENRQTLMFSATFPSDIQRLARDILRPDYLFVAVGQVGGACSDVEQQILEVNEYMKKDKLLEILHNIGHERTMVFVKTKKKADFIATLLCQEKIPSTSIHGDREQREREMALNDFRSGRCPVIVATSVAARGLDIENVLHVINFDTPEDIDEYVHRIGRTGRCGNTGKAISFFDKRGDESRIAGSLVKVLTDAHQEVPAWLEEIAFSGHGMPSYNPQAKTFASTDDRKRGGSRKEDYSTSGFSQSQAVAPVDEEEDWG